MDHETLWAGFCTPPDEARPRAWWHWMDGNVDPEGIRLDLEWLHRVGVRGVQMFDGGMGTPLVVPEKVSHGSPEWRDAVRVATTTARRARPGVRRRDLRRLERRRWPMGRARRRDEEGGLVDDVGRRGRPGGAAAGSAARRRRAVPGLPALGRRPRRPPVGAGLGGAGRTGRPGRRGVRARLGARIRTPSATGGRCSTGASPTPSRCPGTRTARPPRGSSRSSTSRCRSGRSPSACRARRGFAAAPPPSAVLEASDDGVTYRRVAELDAPGNADKAVPVRTLAFPPVTAPPVPAGAHRGEPPRRGCPGWPRACGCRRSCGGSRSSWSRSSPCSPAAGCTRPSSRPASRAAPDYYALDTAGADGRDRPRPDRRRHAVRRGRRPALGGAGRCVADPAAGRLADRADERPGLAGGDRPGGRQARRGEGAPLPRHLPGALRRRRAGRPAQRQHRVRRAEPHRPAARAVHRAARLRPDCRGCPRWPGSSWATPARTDRFLWDFRQTIADLVASEYYGTLEREAHDRGLVYYAEALEDRRPQLGNDLAMRSHADVPMGAMWLFDAGTRPPGADLPRRPEGRVLGRARARQAVHRRRVDDRLPPAVELHPAAAQARRRPGAGPRRHPVLHPHLAAPADAGAAAGHRRWRRSSGRRSSAPSRGPSWPARGSTTSPAAPGC